MPMIQSVTYALVACLITMATASFAFAQRDDRDVVMDDNGNIILNTFGDCVRTDWVSEGNPCAARRYAQERRPAAPVVSRARQLQNEERTVYFEFDKSRIMASEQRKLDSLAKVLQSDAQVRNVSIVGYADRIGSANYNQRLSQRRAKAVESYLHRRGYLNTELAETRWLGESVPVTQCPDKLSRAELIRCLQRDRRVEVEINFYSEDSASSDEYMPNKIRQYR